MRFIRAFAVCAIVVVACSESGLKQAESRLIADPTALTFASVPVNAAARARLVLRNPGALVTHVTRLSFEGADAARFGTVPATADVPAGGDFPILVTFAPVEEKAHAATLVIESDATEATVRVAVTATVVPDTRCGDCSTPPAPACATDLDAVSWLSKGTCVEGACKYQSVVTSCAVRCDAATGTCAGEDVPTPDAGSPDAGTIDPTPDAGTVDPTPDAGTPAAIEPCPAAVAPARAVAGTCGGTLDLSAPGTVQVEMPAGCTRLAVAAWGGGGGGGKGVSQGNDALHGGHGGGGAYAGETMNVTAGESLAVAVGQGGAGGGCGTSAAGGEPGGGRGGEGLSYDGAGGGGFSGVARNGQWLVIAGGGGGGGAHGWGSFFIAGAGGGGGAATGEKGGDQSTNQPGMCAESEARGGGGGSPSAGGAGGSATGAGVPYVFAGEAGRAFVGGHGGDFAGSQGDPGGGGGGGGGVMGGGGGAANWYCNSSGAGGGGGASLGRELTGGNGREPGRVMDAGGAGRGGAGGKSTGASSESGEAGSPGRVKLTFLP